MIVLLFARVDTRQPPSAGYSVLAVVCDPEQQVEIVARLKSGFRGIENAASKGFLGESLGGVFELIATGEGYLVPACDSIALVSERFREFGDVRFFGVYTAEEILKAEIEPRGDAEIAEE